MANATSGVPTTATPFSGEIHKRPLAAIAATYYVGEMIGLNAAGFAQKMDVSVALKFDGLKANSVPVTVESGDAAGDKVIDVQRPRWFRMKVAAAVRGDIGKPVYALFSNEVSFTPDGTNANPIGHMIDIVSATEIEIEPLPYGQSSVTLLSQMAANGEGDTPPATNGGSGGGLSGASAASGSGSSRSKK